MKASIGWLAVALACGCSAATDPGSAGGFGGSGGSATASIAGAGGADAGGVAGSLAGAGGGAGGLGGVGTGAGGSTAGLGGNAGNASAGTGGSAGKGGAGGAGSGGVAGSGDVAATRLKILEYLKSISGVKTISGQHNKEPNSDPAHWTSYVANLTGTMPGLWSGDFLFRKPDVDARGTMIAEAQKQFQAGALINLMWHACAPTVGVSCEWDEGVAIGLSQPQWNDLVTEGGTLNGVWKQRMDLVAAHLQKLQDAGVVVMFRPFHEQNQSQFWWAGRSDANGSKRLYRLTHDYFTKTKGLQNIIWIWDTQDLSGYQQAIPAYSPGFEYFDIAALDVYEGFNQQKYQTMVDFAAGQKLIAIGECAQLPSAADLATASKFVFFMDWAELVQTKNSEAQVKTLYAADRVLTRDELPGWK